MKNFILFLATIFTLASTARAEIKLSDVCRIKGQEENTLHGMGLVVGLKGTGDGDSRTTMRALARYMELMGHRLGNDPRGQTMLEELKGVKNVAMVFLTVTVPAGGAQQGDLIDCKVSALSAKSIEGGYLMLTELHGPVPGDKTVYGIAKGQISIDDIIKPQTGTIARGCQMEQKFQNEFVKDGKLLLVMSKDQATFQMTSLVEQSVNREPDFRIGSTGEGIARALDQVRVQVIIPATYADNPALFASVLMETRVGRPQTDTTVIINERKQAVIVGADVEIGPVAVMHKNRLIQVGGEQLNQFVEVNPAAETQKPKLAALVDALNTLKVPAEDVIDIIKMLKHKRALYGELIIE
ncbi:Flagellar P-ring protein precursor [Anatilimnocola aggregata]|uniref:Flagellar P-ring protein n=1 Tax=Anatilimnocola aggregata TaxID=2528021 RepID=A0A517YKS9_9BACT|nr:flagellar basal body P-ring protein FlgI [Anatilimnocola aggregata]QDU30845.1 Flagellar P-ring protein precursor [Anatilimnocola aggregata]